MRGAAVVTVSDSVHAGTRQDKSGPAVADRLRAQGFEVSVEVVPDEPDAIKAMLLALSARPHICVVFTTGGTGVAPRDVTPEATRAVIEREIPGFGELMRAKGRETTLLAPLSRALAGILGTTLIVNLPGSPRGAVESLDAVIGLVPHVLDLLGGKTEHSDGEKLLPAR